MSNPFFEKSREIANDFLQSIVFLDDRAYSTSENSNQDSIHDLDTIKITKLFSKSKKICAVYAPETLEDISNFEEISKKSDVIILDWYIDINETEETEETEENTLDLDSDAEDDDIRGKYTKKIISSLISQNTKDSLKLILIYTGETDLIDILNQISYLSPNSRINENDFAVFIGNFKILVRAKNNNVEGEDTRFKHLPKSQEMIVSYENLPDFILDEFTKMTTGLISNFVLNSLTSLRENTFKLIALYNKDLDEAFLAHRLLLPNPNDSKDHLIDVFSQSIQAILNYNEIGEKSISKEFIETWLDNIKIDYDIEISKNKIKLDNEFIKKWSDSNFINSILDIYPNIETNKIETKLNDLTKSIGSSFIKGSNNTLKDIEFSILTHHKSNLKNQSAIPKLTLGTIILNQKEGGIDEYLLCIQAKCDSVRVEKDTRFLFLPLIPVNEGKKFHFIIQSLNGDYLRLTVLKDTYRLKTIKFNPTLNTDLVIATKDNQSFYFTSKHNEKLIWICDLRDLHAQRIANLYASQLSRVGLDESEWLRRWSN